MVVIGLALCVLCKEITVGGVCVKFNCEKCVQKHYMGLIGHKSVDGNKYICTM